MEKISRRSFFRLAGGGVAAAIVAPQALLGEPITQVPVEFGWTWYVDKTKVPSTLSEIITKTLRENSHKLRDSLSQNNALLMKLKDNQKVLLRVEKISPEEQTKRMTARLTHRYAQKSKNRHFNYSDKEAQELTFYSGYDDVEAKHLRKII